MIGLSFSRDRLTSLVEKLLKATNSTITAGEVSDLLKESGRATHVPLGAYHLHIFLENNHYSGFLIYIGPKEKREGSMEQIKSVLDGI